MAAKKRRKRKIFYPVYWSIVVICTAAAAVLLCGLWQIMEDYEASMPKYVAQQVGEIFTQRDFETMYRYDDTSLCTQTGEGIQDYITYMERLTAGTQITCREKFSADPDEKVYQVKYGNHKLATFTLRKSGQLSKYGNELWTLGEIRNSVIHPQNYRITVPQTSSVYADGQLLGMAEVWEQGIAHTKGYLPEGYEHTPWQTYSVTRCFTYPQFEVIDAKGRTQRIVPGEADNLTVLINYDDDLRGEAEESVIAAAKAFAMFTSGDCSMRQVLEHIAKDSNAAKYIAGFDDGWIMPHQSVEFQNMKVERYMQYDAEMFSCDVYFDYHIIYRKSTEIYPTGYTFFFTKENGRWVIFDFTTAG